MCFCCGLLLSFRTPTAQMGWPDDPLKPHYYKGLNTELQSELTCHDDGKSLEQFIKLSILIDNLLRSRRTPQPPLPPYGNAAPLPDTEPMQIGLTWISEEERERWIRLNLCLYCGQSGHL